MVQNRPPTGGRYRLADDFPLLQSGRGGGTGDDVNNPTELPAIVHAAFAAPKDSTDGIVNCINMIGVDNIRKNGPLLHRFLLKAENQTIPLCFDVSGAVLLKLLHHPSEELFINGELDSVANGGFSRIVIHFKTDQHVEIGTMGVTVRDGQTVTHYTGQDLITAGGVTVIMRYDKIYIEAGGVRLLILFREKNGEGFLWPVLRRYPSTNNTEGFLALKPAVYEELQRVPVTKLKIKSQEIDVTSDSTVDYTVASTPTINCWLMSAESALQRPLDDFYVAQL